MMYKIREWKDKMTDYYNSEYYIGDMQWTEFLNLVKVSSIQVSSVHIMEHVEQDMQNVSGTYSLDYLVDDFPQLMHAANTSCGIHICIFFDTPDDPSVALSFNPMSSGIVRVMSSVRPPDLDKLLDTRNNV